MAKASTYQPFGFSKPVHMIPKISKLNENVIPPKYDSDRSAKGSSSRRSSRHIKSVQDDSRWPLPPPSYSRGQSPRPSSTRPLPDEEDCETMVPNRRSRASPDGRRLPRLQTSYITPTPSVTSPAIPTPTNFIAQRTLTEKQLKQQLRDVYAALSRTEADRERIMRQTAAGKTDQSRIERKLEAVERENNRLKSRLKELFDSPVSAKGDEVWGSSMYMDSDYTDTDGTNFYSYENYMTRVDNDERF